MACPENQGSELEDKGSEAGSGWCVNENENQNGHGDADGDADETKEELSRYLFDVSHKLLGDRMSLKR